MRKTVSALRGGALVASDGPLGSVLDVYFDDERWAVRYLVVDTGRWMPGRSVLISPASLDPAASDGSALRVRLTREEVRNAPGVDADRPVSRQYALAHAAHYRYPPYWKGPLLWGAAAHPGGPLAAGLAVPGAEPVSEAAERAAQEQLAQADPHLRSASTVMGYTVESRDGSAGAVEDFTIDERTWALEDVVVDTRPWWPGGRVRVPPAEIESIDAAVGKMRVRLTQEELKGLPR